MFSKFFKKDPASASAEIPSSSPPPLAPEWEERLQAAQGNDVALVEILQLAPFIPIKISAVMALSGEEALRQVEREFRSHDRRVHSVAKQCYEAVVKRRETRARARELIEQAHLLSGEPIIPANRLVELDHAWRVLATELLDDGQASTFDDLQARLAGQVRDFAERKRALNRWVEDATQALANLRTRQAEVMNPAQSPKELLAALAGATVVARDTCVAMPASAATSALETERLAVLAGNIQAHVAATAGIEARLHILDGLPLQENSAADDPSAIPAVSPESVKQQWQALAPIPDSGIASALNARFEDWLSSREVARNKRAVEKQHIEEKHKATRQTKDKASEQALIHSLTELLTTIEAALAAGHLAEGVKRLPALQAAIDKSAAGSALHHRALALQAEILRLKGWQHWGGGRVREELVEEAEVLARSVSAADEAHPTKLPVAQLEKYIEQLRDRWKALDRMGGATGKPLWLRFDAALKSAALPVAAHRARLNETRLVNLAAREALLAALDAVSILNEDPGAAPDWKGIALALQHAQTEWRKLGPLEHTVPHKRLAAITKRLSASVARIEQPLQEALRNAQAEREGLVLRAKELSRHAQDRDVVAKIRDLQGQWQRHAKSMPLPRAAENALWTAFKAATDAVMGERDAAFSARNAEYEAQVNVRETLIGRLHALSEATPPAELKQVLAAVDADWRKAGDAGKDKTAKLTAKYQEARDRVRQYLAESGQRQWNVVCDTLLTKLALCAELEAAAASGVATAEAAAVEARWRVLPVLPPVWEPVLQARYKAASSPGAGTSTPAAALRANAERANTLLLQLELALDIPSPTSMEDARRSVKLLAMKNALEGRKSTNPLPTGIDQMTVMTFGCDRLGTDQAQRLDAIISALRLAGPGVLVSSK